MEALFDGPEAILERAALHSEHTSPEQRYWLLQDLETLLEKAALKASLLVCLDDLQWADNGTAAALRSLPTRLTTVPVGWVIALPPGEGSSQFRSAMEGLEREGAEKIVLGPLDQAGVAQVARDVLLAEPDSGLLKMAERAGGSPFLLVELLSGLREEGLVRIESGRAVLVASQIPHRVSESMRTRLQRLSGSARQVATVAAALGRRFSLNDLAAMLSLSPSALLGPVEELTHYGLLVEREGRLAFNHDLTLEAVRASLPESVRRALDRQAAAIVPLFPMDVADEARLVHIALAVQDHELGVAAGAANLADAVELYDGGPRPLALALALEDLGDASVESGATQEGLDAYGRGLELYARTGAAWDAGRIRGRLRALGVRRRLVSAARPERGWAAMTESELAVARLVADGLSNREVAERLFVSPHTVNSHLRHVFGKACELDARVDVELAEGVA